MSTQNNKDVLLDHDADGIQEYDNNLPRWWLYGFYFTIAFAAVYMVYYHVSGNGKVMENEYAAEMKQAAGLNNSAAYDGMKKPVGPLSDPASLAAGKAIFEGNTNICHTCHRLDLGGQVGPNLTDDYWMHGCGLDSVMHSITTGYPEKGMLPYGSGVKLTDLQLVQVASYILSMHGTNPPEPKPVDAERDVICGAVAQ